MEDNMNKQESTEPQTQQPTQQPSENKPDSSDVDKNKLMAVIGYILPFLFFIPLLSDETKNSPFAKFHANQQLNLLLFWVIGQAAATILAIVLIGFLIGFVVWVMGLIFMILGVINSAKGEMKKLPMIGKYEILK